MDAERVSSYEVGHAKQPDVVQLRFTLALVRYTG